MKFTQYVICQDDNSKLSGFSEQVILGTSATVEDGVLLIFLRAGQYINFNWSRVRWYRCDGTVDVQVPT